MKRPLLSFLFFLFTIPIITNAEIYLNELMYNPEGNDNNHEYIEVYSNESLENYTIEDLSSEDVLKLVKNSENNFALIVEEEFNFSDIDANIYSVGATIGNNLNNERDVVVLRNPEGKLIDAMSYSDEDGGNDNGLSLCRIPDKIGKLTECPSSPGKINSKDVNYEIRINELLPDPLGDDNAQMPQGEWVELFNNGEADIALDGFQLKDDFGHKIFISDSQVIGSTIIKKDEFLVVYMNGKSGFLNNEDFESVSLVGPTGNLIDKVSYSGSSEDTSWALIENNWIFSNPTINRENPKNEENVETDSEIIIKKIFLGEDNKAKWGDNIRVNLEVYKGDTGKESVQMWVSKKEKVVSKRTRFNVHEKFKKQEFTVPVQIYPNCKENYDDGEYELIVNGLDFEVKESFEINGLTASLCEQSKEKKEEFTYEILEAPTQVKVGEEFNTKLRITNNLAVKKEFSVWDEVKDGAKILSNKENKQIVELPGGVSSIIDLRNSIKDYKEGDFVFNVKILEKGKKRPEIISNSIKVEDEREPNIFESNLNEDNEITGDVIYASKSNKQKNLLIYFFVLVAAMMGIYGLFKHD